MAAMLCPHCGKETTCLRTTPLVSHIYCDNCRPETSSRDRKLYTGREFWHERDCYTKEQVRELNHDYEQTTKKRVADQFKNMRKSTRKELYGE